MKRRMGIALLLGAVAAVLFFGAKVAATGDTAPTPQAPTPEPVTGIVEAIRPPTIVAARLVVTPDVVSGIVQSIKSAIAQRKGERAAFTQLWPLYTGAQQQRWVGLKHRAIVKPLSITRARTVRSLEDSLRGTVAGFDPAAMGARVTANREDPSWLRQRPSNAQVLDLIFIRAGVSEHHEIAPAVKAAWTREKL